MVCSELITPRHSKTTTDQQRSALSSSTQLLQSQQSDTAREWSHKTAMKLVVDTDECWRRLRLYCALLTRDEQQPLPRLVVFCGNSSLQVGTVRDVMQLLDGASKRHVHKVLSVSAGEEALTERQRNQIPKSFQVSVAFTVSSPPPTRRDNQQRFLSLCSAYAAH